MITRCYQVFSVNGLTCFIIFSDNLNRKLFVDLVKYILVEIKNVVIAIDRSS